MFIQKPLLPRNTLVSASLFLVYHAIQSEKIHLTSSRQDFFKDHFSKTIVFNFSAIKHMLRLHHNVSFAD